VSGIGPTSYSTKRAESKAAQALPEDMHTKADMQWSGGLHLDIWLSPCGHYLRSLGAQEGHSALLGTHCVSEGPCCTKDGCAPHCNRAAQTSTCLKKWQGKEERAGFAVACIPAIYSLAPKASTK
jgi:hypothetical protein